MALSDGEKEELTKWTQTINKYGDQVGRYAIYYHLDKELATQYAIAVSLGDKSLEAVNALHEKERAIYNKGEKKGIDPVTVADIVLGLLWPSISAVDTAFVDDPDNARYSTMRGIPAAWCLDDDGLMKGKLQSWLIPGDTNGFFGPTDNPIKESRAALKAAYDQYNNNDLSFSEPDQKDAIKRLFESEKAAMLWWIDYGARNDDITKPLKCIQRCNPYLGYFTMMIRFQGGSGAMNDRGISTAITNKLKDIGEKNDIYTMGKGTGDEATKLVANHCNAMLAGVQAQYKWLQEQKVSTNNAKYYDGWFAKFFKNPKSLVNMLIIINEEVCLNINNKYTHAPETTAGLRNLGEGLKATLKLNIGD